MLTDAIILETEWLGNFVEEMRAGGRSENTLEAYAQDVKAFAGWYEESNGQALTPDLMTGVDLRAYRQWAFDGKKMAPATWNRRRISLALFCEWAHLNGYLNYNPFQGVDIWQEEELPPRWLEKGEISKFERIMEQNVNGARTEHWRWQAVRDQALISLMIYGGLREGEAVGLDVEDVLLSERKGRVIIRRGKGDKRREVPLNTEARRALKMWLDLASLEAGALFIGKGGERLTTRTVQRMVAEIGRRAGLEVSPHDLRHTFAKRLLDCGVPLTVVSKLLGHARLETTARYTKPGWGDYERAVEWMHGE